MLNKMAKINRFVLGPSLNLPQHINVEQVRGKRLCSGAFFDVEHDRGKRLCFGAFSRST